MSQISKFIQVREDGRLVPSSMTVGDMLSLGWEPSKMVALLWNHDGKEIEIEMPRGVHGIVVPGGHFVAAICNEGDANPYGRLLIFSPDGTVHGKLENRVLFSQQDLQGRYSWFESAMTTHSNTFGVVFETRDDGEFRCDIDASGPTILDIVRAR